MARLAVVLPRAMDFSVGRATSIDLSAHDLVLHSRHRDETLVLGEASGEPLPGVALSVLPDASRRARVAAVARIVRRERIEAVVVHQHLPTAAALARRLPGVPVLLHRHNYERLPSHPLRRWWKLSRLARLASLSFVSRAACDDFTRQHPAARPQVVPNGLDMRAWSPAVEREREILVVGRAVSVKGILPAALGIEGALAALPGWRATFVLSGLKEEPDYVEAVARVVARTPRARLVTDRPFAEVKALTERASIAIVPSVWDEPFGRTALEALAGGAALVTSGRGGLAEVAGDAAELLPAVEPYAIRRAVLDLAAADDRRRTLAAAGRDRAERLFDIRACAARLDGLVDAAVA
jgi:glycosyltransferase involved in cell wall biosynthesis